MHIRPLATFLRRLLTRTLLVRAMIAAALDKEVCYQESYDSVFSV